MVKKKVASKASASEKTTTTTTTTSTATSAAPSPARGAAATTSKASAAPAPTRSSRSATAAAIPPELPKALSSSSTTGASASTTAAAPSGRTTRGGGGSSNKEEESKKSTAAAAPATTMAPPSKKSKADDKKAAAATKGKKGEAAAATETPAPAPAPSAPAPAPAMIYPVMGSPGIPQGTAAAAAAAAGGAPHTGIAYTDQDILLPTTNEQIAARPANREYIQLLQANCAAFHSLPSNEQAWMLNNVCHFLTAVRKHRMLHYHPYYGWRVLTEPLPFVVAEMSLDTFKRAAFRFHPLWLLGDHDPSGYHRGTPFVHRKVTGAWRKASVDDVRMILQGEGLKNLLLLPTGMDFVDDESDGGAAAEDDAKNAESV